MIKLPSKEEVLASSKSAQRKRRKRAPAEDEEGMTAVLYIGHIPHGFYEDQMRGYFSQFGDVVRLRLSRSKKTGGSRGYAFLEFKSIEDARIVADCMDNYFLGGKALVVKQLPSSKVHSRMWKGANKEFRKFDLRAHHAERVNRPKTAAAQAKANRRLLKKETKKREKLKALGIDYDFPGYAAALSTNDKKVSSKTSPPPSSSSSSSSRKAAASSKLSKKTAKKTKMDSSDEAVDDSDEETDRSPVKLKKAKKVVAKKKVSSNTSSEVDAAAKKKPSFEAQESPASDRKRKAATIDSGSDARGVSKKKEKGKKGPLSKPATTAATKTAKSSQVRRSARHK